MWGRYIARRIGQGVIVLWAAYTISFLILYLLPGDAATLFAGGGDQEAVDPELVAQLRSELGLDRPLWEQYLVALGKALTGDFGVSTQTGRPASDLLLESLPPTLALTAFAFVLSVVFGVVLALSASLARARWLRNLLSSLPPLGVSIPVFWIGLLLLQASSFRIRLFPSMGNEGFESLVLPAITIAIPSGAFIAQLLSRSLRSTLAQPYVEIVRAKGASERRVQLGHAFRNAAIPSLTMVGVLIGGLLSGAVVTETVFSRLGIGRLVVTAVNNRDVPVVQTVVVFAAFVFVVANLVVDLVYPLIDRRITLARTAFVAA
ncbi:Glutathione transport system permease protein GsiC [Microbacterium trichothecenolyticum]|uniref:Glutathione transport system permease protein GsiC n=2 Tax=Microbacterium trichothecenolyticum TaxID=69370 RepID=A0A0M2H772_MICTR|nr:ABC transporter permease [Microbacterium trichothecenolyticum]KJL40402.1 Glutathione transport system permease protein GsiC [Microbacterium trichothecenolyticum]